MLKKILLVSILTSLSFSVLANIEVNDKVLDSSLIDATDEQSILLMKDKSISSKEKQVILDKKIAELKADILKWEEYQTKLLTVKADFEKKISDNDAKIDYFMQEIDELTTAINEKSQDIDKKTEEVEVAKSAVVNEPKQPDIVEYNLSNGKKLKLIKHTVIESQSLDNIVFDTFKDKSKITPEKIKQRLSVIISLNNNLKDKDSLVVGQVIYIPFFKE